MMKFILLIAFSALVIAQFNAEALDASTAQKKIQEGMKSFMTKFSKDLQDGAKKMSEISKTSQFKDLLDEMSKVVAQGGMVAKNFAGFVPNNAISKFKHMIPVPLPI